MYRKKTIDIYLKELAAKSPAPGGGSAAALAGAIGAALISMAANFTVGKEKYKSVEEEIKKVLSSSETLRERLMSLVDEDVEAYKKVSSVYKLPKETTEDRKKREQAIQDTLKQALLPPLEVCKCSHAAFKLCAIILEKGNVNLISDVDVAAELLKSAFQSAFINVEINLKIIKDEEFVGEIRKELEPLKKEIRGDKG